MKIALLLLVPYKTSQTESFTEELVLAYKEAECPSERERAWCVCWCLCSVIEAYL